MDTLLTAVVAALMLGFGVRLMVISLEAWEKKLAMLSAVLNLLSLASFVIAVLVVIV